MFSSKNILNPIKTRYGFTLIELMIVISIVGILASVTIPSYMAQYQRRDVVKALHMADTIRDNITEYYRNNLSFPADNKNAGVPAPELFIGNKVTSIQVEDGAIHITLGNKVSQPLQDKIISMRPAIVIGSPASPISWICGYEKPVSGMEAVGMNKTDIDKNMVPASCGS